MPLYDIVMLISEDRQSDVVFRAFVFRVCCSCCVAFFGRSKGSSHYPYPAPLVLIAAPPKHINVHFRITTNIARTSESALRRHCACVLWFLYCISTSYYILKVCGHPFYLSGFVSTATQLKMASQTSAVNSDNLVIPVRCPSSHDSHAR